MKSIKSLLSIKQGSKCCLANLAMLQKVRRVCMKLSNDNVDTKSPAH